MNCSVTIRLSTNSSLLCTKKHSFIKAPQSYSSASTQMFNMSCLQESPAKHFGFVVVVGSGVAGLRSSTNSSFLCTKRNSSIQASQNHRYPSQTTTSCLQECDTKYFDFIVVGSGVAGLRYALEVAKHGSVAIVTKAEPQESNTNYAQGGVSAVFCPSDSVESHMQDTIVAGAYLCDEETVREASARGKRARALVTCISHAGTHGASEWSYEQSQITGIEPSPVERIDYLHRRADGTPTSELVDQRSERMHGIVLEAETAAELQGTPLTPAQKFQIANRAVVQVYGRHSHGRVRGGGSNITPSQYNQAYPPIASRSTQSTTTAAASSSVEEDARRYYELRRQIEDNPELQRYI